MSDVFISYSRKDKEFVKVLHQALTTSHYNAWVDWEDIPLTANWWSEIKSGIEQADTFVFIISPDSIHSKVCGQELDHAVTHNKRLVPIVRRDGFDSELMRPALRQHNWLFFRDEDDFDSAFQSLVKALDTDLDHVKRHTRLLMKAIEWEHQHHNSDLLIRGSELEHTIQWLTQSSAKEPRSTELQLNYVNESRKAELAQRDAEIQRQKKARKAIATALVGAVVCLIIAIGLGLFSFGQYRTAEAERQQATISEIRSLTISSNASYNSDHKLDALIEALKAKSRLNSVPSVDDVTRNQVRLSLQQAVYDVREKNRLQGHLDAVSSISFSPDGKTIASASSDTTIRLWNLDEQSIKTLRRHTGRVYHVSFSLDGKMLVSSGEDGIKLWNLEGQELKTLQDRWMMVTASFSPDSKTIISSSAVSRDEAIIKFWSLEGQGIKTIQTSDPVIRNLTLSPDKTTIAVLSNKMIKLFSLEGQELKTQQYSDRITDLSFSPDSKIIAFSAEDGSINLWNTDTQDLKPFKSVQSGSAYSVNFSPDGTMIATSGSDGVITIWTLNGQLLTSFNGGYGSWSSVVRFSPDSQTIAYGNVDGSIRLWSLERQEVKTFQDQQREVLSTSFSPDGKTIASASRDGTIQLWTLDGRASKAWQGHTAEITSIRFSPDGKTIASGSGDETVKLWNLQGQSLQTFAGHTDWVNDVRFSPDGKTIASASWDGTIKLWDLRGRELKKLQDVTWAGVLGISFSPDGKTIAAANLDNTVKLWSVTGELLNTLKGHKAAINRVSFSPDGNIIASASDDKQIKLWSYPSGRELKTFRAHNAIVRVVSFAPNGQMIATASDDNTIKLWTLEGQELKTLRGHTGGVNDISFSPDGKMIASASDDKTVKLWNAATLNDDQLIVRGCQWVQEYLILHPEVLQDTEACQSDTLFIQAASALVSQAEDLAWEGDVQGAIAKFQMALEWNSQLQIDPEKIAQQLATKAQAERLAVEARDLGRSGKIRQAIAAYTQAQFLDPDLQIPFSSWRSLCWNGSLRDFVQDVVFACDRAVHQAPYDSWSLEGRGINQARRGDFKGAVADLEKAIANTSDEESIDRCQRWIETLQSGKNPITPTEIKVLLNE
jgi:WD40 repeat protein